jgi:hypothetical protein
MIFGDLLWGGVFNPRKDDGLPNHNIEIHVIVGHKEILSHEAIGWDLKGIQPESDRFGEKINSPSESGMSGRQSEEAMEIPKCQFLSESINWNNGVAVLQSILKEEEMGHRIDESHLQSSP